jgi:hypothetical protein
LGVVEDLVGKALRGLRQLQVNGLAMLDGGVSIRGPVAVDGLAILPVARNQYRVRMFLTGAQALAGTGYQKVLLDTTSYDPNKNVDLVNHRWVCPVPGYYLMIGGLSASVTGGRLIANLFKNGVLITQGNTDSGGSVSGAGSSVVSDLQLLAVGDYLELWAYQNSGAPNINPASSNVYMAIEYRGPV